MLKLKKIIAEVSFILAIFATIFVGIRLVTHDVPTLLNGYEEIAVEYDYVEDYDYMGNAYDRQEVTKTVKKPVKTEEAIEMIFDNVVVLVLSIGVFITYPTYKEYADY